MRDLGGLVFSIVVVVLIVWIALKLIGLAFKLLFVVLAIALGVFVYFLVASMLKGRDRVGR